MSFKVGEPGTGESKYQKKEYFQFKSGTSLVLRILPAMGALADKGVWNKYYATHFGYRGTNGKMFLFQSTLERDRVNKDVIIQGDKALDRANEYKEKQEKLKQVLRELSAQDPKRPALEAKLAEISDLAQTFNVDKKYYVNAIDLTGKIGVLGLGYKDFNTLKDLRKKLQDEEQIDIVSVKNGIFLNFTKNGRGIDTVSTITPFMETTVGADGKKSRDYKTLPITEELFPKLEREAHDLANLYAKVTPEQIEQMVAGGPAAVDIVRKMVYGDRASSSATAVKTETASTQVEDEPSLNIDDESSSESAPAATAKEKSAADVLADLGIDL